MNYTQYMNISLDIAHKAIIAGELPVGAIIIHRDSGRVISQSHNQTEQYNNALMHAEIMTINETCKITNEKYLYDYDMYVTLEPCKMCLAALNLCRIGNVYYGCKSYINESSYTAKIYDEILDERCSVLLNKFFDKKRKNDQ